MKTKAITILCAILMLAACSKNEEATTTPEIPSNNTTTTEPAQPITFNLTATHPDDAATTRGGESGGWRWQSWDDDGESAGKATPAMTRAVKTTWQAGDAIFVFFTGDDDYSRVTVPRHLKMTYDGTSWTSVEYNGATATPGALQLRNGDAGTMTAVYLPYGSNATVSAAGEEDQYGRYHTFAFSETHYAYYMTATLPYTVTNNTVSGAFIMMIPDDYVQFFVQDDNAKEDVKCQLGIDTVIPVGLVSVGDDGTITETSDKMASDNLPGFYYFDDDSDLKGYLFYGKLNPYYNSLYRPYPQYEDVHKGHYFAKIKPNYIHEDNNNSGDEYEHPSGSGTPVIRDERYDYFVRDKTLASHDAIKLPDADEIIHFNGDTFAGGKWLEVGKDIKVKLQYITDGGATITDLGTWYTCNCNESVPESYVELYTWEEATSRFAGSGLPSKEQFQPLIDNCTWTWVRFHDRPGVVVKSDTGFLFLPTHDETGGQYRTKDMGTEYDKSYILLIDGHDSETWRFVHVDQEYNSIRFPVRCIVQ